LGYYTYYCEVTAEDTGYKQGVYTVTTQDHLYAERRTMGYPYSIIGSSNRVWRQGPKGGVKIVKDRNHHAPYVSRYVTNDKQKMEQFIWIKLVAKELS